jgi:hypothetical protein
MLQHIPREYRAAKQNLYVGQGSLNSKGGRAMTHAVSFRCLTEEALV